jgi:imidazolonepropionase-like amidohydrolase
MISTHPANKFAAMFIEPASAGKQLEQNSSLVGGGRLPNLRRGFNRWPYGAIRPFIFILLALVPSALFAQETIALEGATIYIDAKTKLENATIVIQNGTVNAIGATVTVPANAKRINAKGMVITPGLVDASTNLGLSEVAQVGSTNEGQFGRKLIHAAYRVTDGYNPDSMAIPIARTGGVTSVVAAPSGGLLAGTSAWMSLASKGTVASLTIQSPLAMYASIGEGSVGAGDGARGVILERLREALDDAVQYSKNKAAFEKNQTREYSASRLDLEALLPVVQGKMPLAVYAERSSDIEGAMKVAAEFKIKLIIVGGTESWMLAKELAAAKVSVILNPTDNLPDSFDKINVRDDVAKLLSDAGVNFAISTRSESSNVRKLRQEAGTAVSYGLSWEAAFNSITRGPAEIFGLKGRGSLELGAPADLVVWSGDPLELSSRVLQVFCDGIEQPKENHQSALLTRYRTLPAK